MEKQLYYGMKGLQKLLGCSEASAHKYKKTGRIPFSQIGHKLIFDRDEVLAALRVKKLEGGHTSTSK